MKQWMITLNQKKLLLNYLKGDTLYVSEEELVSRVGTKAELVPALNQETMPKYLMMEFAKKNFALALKLVNKAFGEREIDLNKIIAPDGRAQFVQDGEKLFVIDYAHTPDALENIIKNLKESFPNKKLITLFGCGGDRDRAKRPLMGKAAEDHSDEIVITTDNPRYEDPKQIIDDILEGVSPESKVIVDRKKAIEYIFTRADEETLVLIAGKGSEDYIDVKGKKLPYSDLEELNKQMEQSW